MNKKGFTLIELLAVIVILAIIALIATPIVLDIIKDSKENARERSIDNIIHAAEIEYAKQQVTGNTADFLTFDLGDKNSGLEFNGERPKGTITIYPNGKVYLNATFEDGESYIKLPDSTVEDLQTDGKVIGSSALWDTDGKGTIQGFDVLPQELELYIFSLYVQNAYSFATFPRTDENGNRYPEADKSIYEFEPEIIEPHLSRQFLNNKKLKQEINDLLEIFNVKEQLTEEEVNTLLQKNETKIPYAIDAINNWKKDGYIDEDNFYNLKAYELLKSSIDDSFIIVPNYIMHDDGSLEKITAIGDMAFVYSEWVGSNLNIVSNINNILLNKKLNDISYKLDTEENIKGINLIISNGIEKIGTSAFSFSFLNSVKFPNTLKEIGDASFDLVYGINNLILPESLEKIGDAAFLLSNIEGELIIPSNVKYIGASAFASGEGFGELGTTAIDINKYNNHISNITFKSNSKIETIGESAFVGNSVIELTLPSSIKSIGETAFYMNSLKNVIIKKEQGVDLSIGENAFGTANVIYQP